MCYNPNMQLQILRMAEIVKKQGGVYIAPPRQAEQSLVLAKGTITELFWSYYERNHVLCFSPNSSPQELPQNADFQKLDSPFDVFSIEILGSNITVARPGDNSWDTVCLLIAEAKIPFPTADGGYWAFALLNVNGAEIVVAHLCFNNKLDQEVSVVHVDGHPFEASNSLMEIIQVYIGRLNSEKAGEQKVNERIKVRNSQGENVIHKIKRVIHIVPGSNTKSYTESKGLKLDFSHRWFVRGHWMHYWMDEAQTIPDRTKIGKNRHGEYVEIGRTWRSEYVKGPDDKVLVKKVRVIKPEAE